MQAKKAAQAAAGRKKVRTQYIARVKRAHRSKACVFVRASTISQITHAHTA